MRRLYNPISVAVLTGAGGVPHRVAGKRVASVREEWLVEEGWWAESGLRRRYFELVLDDGSDVVVFRRPDGRWFRQRA